jgi:tripartite-type tricarboxylate transporter receptor subunit TctC
VPDVPTLAEAGIAGVESGTWNAIVAPPKTPRAIVAKLSQGINEVLNDPEVKAHLAEVSLQPVGGTPEQTGAFIREETQRWGDLIRAAHVTID